MQVAGRTADVELQAERSPHRVSDGRPARPCHRHVRDDDGVRPEPATLRPQEARQAGATHLLFAFDQADQIDRHLSRRAKVGFQGLEVGEELALVVARAPAVEGAGAHRGTEGRRPPFAQRVRGLHVVVAVDEKGPPAGHLPGRGKHKWMAGRRNHPGAGQSHRAKVPHEPACAAFEVGRPGRLGADRGKANELLQFLQIPRPMAAGVGDHRLGAGHADSDGDGFSRWQPAPVAGLADQSQQVTAEDEGLLAIR